ncbi:hypothetical protein GCM10010521_50360 [Streptomyces rameus]|uniref:Uncharacterized protein n=1 Tax=Streptomyces rameus TaxID=68261 RepID=A0ABP6NWF3_9ACTN
MLDVDLRDPHVGERRLRRWGSLTGTSAASANTPPHQLADDPGAYDPHLNVGFAPLRGGGPPTDGSSQAA